MNLLRSSGFGSSGCWREKASSRCVNVAARFAKADESQCRRLDRRRYRLIDRNAWRSRDSSKKIPGVMAAPADKREHAVTIARIETLRLHPSSARPSVDCEQNVAKQGNLFRPRVFAGPRF